ncbi:MAG TPA: FAD-dependent oxidoreductase [Candidatus Sulfotelmatobacter sp.]|nr:FAD-dependent oxidoreductase [Candidatus Sulfotelmatobacter sp.]
MTACDIAIIGAGPYGIAASAHLRTIKGLDVHTFGEPMVFWQRNMPKGMLLRSGWEASHIADPNQSLTLDIFRKETGKHFTTPVPLERFVNYGLWHQQRSVPDLDRRRIVAVEPAARGFRLVLEDGESMLANRLVIAAGISSFTWRPAEFDNLPSALATHTSEHIDFERFRGREVLVIGGGQSALESAALLHETGVNVEIVARASEIRWLGGIVSRTIHRGFGPKISKLLYAPTDVGPAGISQIVARPDLVRRFSRPIQDWLRKRSIRPAGARWLVERLKDVPMHLGRTVVSATSKGERVKIRLDDGSERDFDHVFLGTGYRVDVSKYDFLTPKLAGSIARHQGYPRLTDGFETSVPGLHILGAPAVWSFGPLMQFVVGTHYSGRALMQFVARKAAGSKVRVGQPLAAGLELSHPHD